MCPHAVFARRVSARRLRMPSAPSPCSARRLRAPSPRAVSPRRLSARRPRHLFARRPRVSPARRVRRPFRAPSASCLRAPSSRAVSPRAVSARRLSAPSPRAVSPRRLRAPSLRAISPRRLSAPSLRAVRAVSPRAVRAGLRMLPPRANGALRAPSPRAVRAVSARRPLVSACRPRRLFARGPRRLSARSPRRLSAPSLRAPSAPSLRAPSARLSARRPRRLFRAPSAPYLRACVEGGSSPPQWSRSVPSSLVPSVAPRAPLPRSTRAPARRHGGTRTTCARVDARRARRDARGGARRVCGKSAFLCCRSSRSARRVCFWACCSAALVTALCLAQAPQRAPPTTSPRNGRPIVRSLT